jgi:nitrate reductase cytochrome c-type subunit
MEQEQQPMHAHKIQTQRFWKVMKNANKALNCHCHAIPGDSPPPPPPMTTINRNGAISPSDPRMTVHTVVRAVLVPE